MAITKPLSLIIHWGSRTTHLNLRVFCSSCKNYNRPSELRNLYNLNLKRNVTTVKPSLGQADKLESVSCQGVIGELETKISNGELLSDEHQRRIADELQRVFNDVKGYSPPVESIFSKIGFFSKKSKKKNIPKGLYIYGSVGGGKTMLMDLFYDCIEVMIWTLLTYYTLSFDIFNTPKPRGNRLLQMFAHL